MHLVVLTPEEEIFNGEVSKVKVPGENGQFEVLKNHAAIVSSLTAGVISWLTEKGESISLQIEQGFIEVINNEVALLVRGVKKSET